MLTLIPEDVRPDSHPDRADKQHRDCHKNERISERVNGNLVCVEPLGKCGRKPMASSPRKHGARSNNGYPQGGVPSARRSHDFTACGAAIYANQGQCQDSTYEARQNTC